VSLGLKCLESVTIIRKTELDLDIVLHKSETGSGEFHAWQIKGNLMAIPWQLPKEAIHWEGGVSGFWGDVEGNAFDESTSIKTVRLVSSGTLGQVPR
jgi:hypothetical protein